jgi:uncharacterized membrane protein
MTFYKDIREMSIALISTSALLLTILAVVHFKYSITLLLVTATGLYATIGFGVANFVFLIIASREETSTELSATRKWILFFIYAQLCSFLIGLIGIYAVVVLTSSTP